MLRKLIALEFIITAHNNFFDIAITPYCNDFVVIATIFSIVIGIFSCSVIWLCTTLGLFGYRLLLKTENLLLKIL